MNRVYRKGKQKVNIFAPKLRFLERMNFSASIFLNYHRYIKYKNTLMKRGQNRKIFGKTRMSKAESENFVFSRQNRFR